MSALRTDLYIKCEVNEILCFLQDIKVCGKIILGQSGKVEGRENDGEY